MENDATRWQNLFADLKVQANTINPTDSNLAQVNRILGSVRLIQPFNWPAWKVWWPQLDEIPHLSLADCVRHITRMVRAERFADAEVTSRPTWGMLVDGRLEALCRTAFLHTGGAIVPPFAEMDEAT